MNYIIYHSVDDSVNGKSNVYDCNYQRNKRNRKNEILRLKTKKDENKP